MQAIILGNLIEPRMHPLGRNAPLCMLDLCGKPIIEHTIEQLRAQGLERIVMSLGAGADQVIDHFGAGRRWGVRIEYSLEERVLGTAGSIRRAQAFLGDTFIVVPANIRADMDFSIAYEQHRRAGRSATLFAAPSPVSSDACCFRTTSDGCVSSFIPEPGSGDPRSYAYVGICVLDRSALACIPHETESDLQGGVFPLLLQNQESVGLFGIDRRPRLIDSPTQYMEAHFDLLSSSCRTEAGGVVVSDGVDIHPTARIVGPVYIGRGARIHRRAVIGPFAVIGESCVVDESARVRSSVMQKGSWVECSGELRKSILTTGARVLRETQALGDVVTAGGTRRHMVPISDSDLVWRPLDGLAMSWSGLEAARALREQPQVIAYAG